MEKNKSPNITEIGEKGKKKTKDKKSICNAFNRFFSEMGIDRGQIVQLNVEKIKRKFWELNFRPFTLREIYNVIDKLDNNKAPGPRYIIIWALKSGKMLLGQVFRLYLTIAFKIKFSQQILRMHTLLSNFRITNFAKVFKRLLTNQLVE